MERTTPPTLGSFVFLNAPANLRIYVPAGSVGAYRDAWGSLLPYPGASRIVAQ